MIYKKNLKQSLMSYLEQWMNRKRGYIVSSFFFVFDIDIYNIYCYIKIVVVRFSRVYITKLNYNKYKKFKGGIGYGKNNEC